jgi:hypothetical protein
MSEWQPIDSAPHDGTWILAVGPDWDGPVMCAWLMNDRVGRAVWTFHGGECPDEDRPPTHWLQLPKWPTNRAG